nr:unnamed protein product [Callosobruchus chinensis]
MDIRKFLKRKTDNDTEKVQTNEVPPLTKKINTDNEGGFGSNGLKNTLGLRYKGGVQGAFICREFKKYKDFHNSAKSHEQSLRHKESTMK